MAKFRVTFKSPDALDTACDQEILRIACDEAETALGHAHGGVDDGCDFERIVNDAVDRMRDFAAGWMKYSEYVTIEFDEEAGTAEVVKS